MPSVLTAAEVVNATATCFHVVPPATVVTGLDLLTVVPSPTAPVALYPQVHSVPLDLIPAATVAFTWLLSQFEILTQSVNPPITVTGLDLSTAVPSPNPP